MPTPRCRQATTRVAGALAGLSIGALMLAGAPAPAATGAPRPHWGLYQWSGGREKASVRAFWVFDRTGDDRMHDIIRLVTDAWNSARDNDPDLPYVAVYRDDANAGKCFVNRTPGYSVASACMFPENTEGVKALAGRNADDQGHLTGAAFAVAQGLNTEEEFSAVCHAFGHVMGLEHSEDPTSCMSNTFDSTKFKWYTDADGRDVVGLYDHPEAPVPATTTPTTTPVESTTTSTAGTTTTSGATTTSTSGGGGTTTTAAGATTTTAAAPPPTATLPVTVPTTSPLSTPLTTR